MDRKEFFKVAIQKSLLKGINILEKTGVVDKLEQISKTPEIKQRPPGALEDDHLFLARCTGCDECMKACPVNVILIEDPEKRDPIIYPEKDPCIHCPEYTCISSCPTGALQLSLMIK